MQRRTGARGFLRCLASSGDAFVFISTLVVILEVCVYAVPSHL